MTAKFHAPRRLRFEDTKRIMSPEMRPKSLGTFEKGAPGVDEAHLATLRGVKDGVTSVSPNKGETLETPTLQPAHGGNSHQHL